MDHETVHRPSGAGIYSYIADSIKYIYYLSWDIKIDKIGLKTNSFEVDFIKDTLYKRSLSIPVDFPINKDTMFYWDIDNKNNISSPFSISNKDKKLKFWRNK